MTSRIDELRAQLRALDAATPDADSAAKRTALERELLDLVVKGGDAPVAAAAPAVPLAAAAGLHDVPGPQRPSGALVAGIVMFVLVFGAAGYAWLGNHDGWNTAPGVVAKAEGGAPPGASHSMDQGQIAAMAEQLAERLKAKPDDAEGWLMLGRSYTVLGRFPEAAPAYKKVLELRPKDAQAHADYADALGMVNGRRLDGEPSELIAKALNLDPDNLKALALAGTIAFQKSDFATAVKHWERAIGKAEPNSELGQNLKNGVAEARQRGGLPGGAALPPATAQSAMPPAAAAPGGNAPPAADAAAAAITGRITLAAGLKDKAGPEDTVFIFARNAQGPKMPLAILRKQVKDLPADFTLDDSLAMSPAARLSGANAVVVGARVSKSGNAMPQPGDLQGLSAVVKPGAKGLQIEIAEAVQ
ncbi:cytochrome c biogenesis factor [Burkholderiales bacterium JOSHI_001]|nr:cytochrome c biogenesis factor [Burkholderiales bacterium JOSHI_001]